MTYLGDVNQDIRRLQGVNIRCYFGCGNLATTTRTRPDGAVKNCPTCKDCADLIDEQNRYEQQAWEHDMAEREAQP